jgi:hypothetical protein
MGAGEHILAEMQKDASEMTEEEFTREWRK